MKNLPVICILILFSFFLLPSNADSATLPGIDPCELTAPAKVYAAFPELKTMERQTIGSNTSCNYLDKYEIPALIVFVAQADHRPLTQSLAMLGSGYTVEKISGLGDEAAMAIQQAKPEYGLTEGVAQLQIRKGDTLLSLSPVRISAASVEEELKKLTALAEEMLKKL